MKKEDGRSLHTLWNEQTYKLRERRYYPPAAMDNLARIGECLGCEEDEMQIASLRLLMGNLDEEIEKIKQKISLIKQQLNVFKNFEK